MTDKNSIKYSTTGVNYKSLDYLKRLAQQAGKQTSKNLEQSNFKEVEESRGESAFVWEEEDCYRSFVMEALGTKNLVADAMYQSGGKSYYDQIAKDTVACVINDLIVVGAKPLVLNAYFGAGTSEWWFNKARTKDLVEGFRDACNESGVTWGGGETPGMKGVIVPETIVLAGSAIGIIKPKQRLILGEKLTEGDAIVLIESSGIHTNGLSLARFIAEKLPEGYLTKLENGKSFGEALLTPSHIYAKLVQDLFEQNIDIHYMVHITGHGFRKLMRANKELTYEINNLPTPQPIFDFIQKHSQFSDEEMYATFNMGAGFAIFVPENLTKRVLEIAQKNNFKALNAGMVKSGPKQVIIKPKNIVYKGSDLEIR
ncbi:phosphoribosylformylglycinamidine cyclo-ligase [Candidatus Daviesbacteria bacterium]|nr:phosphoribosylformylglycinamidine cyclo-ligase [Candidatus Daviesbacteria bacterium]